MIADAISWVLLLGGSFFLVVGAIGFIRLPDFYTRIHAAGLTDTGGAALILFGLMVQGGLTLVTVKLALILVFLWFTSPAAAHALTKASLHQADRDAKSVAPTSAAPTSVAPTSVAPTSVAHTE